MCAEEFEYWKAFNVLEPIGILREDAMFANISRTVVDAQRYKFKDDLSIRDFTIFNRDNFEDTEPDIEQTMRNIKAVFGALSAKSKA